MAKPYQLKQADKALRIINSYYPTSSCSRYKKFRTAQNNTKTQQNIALFAIQTALLRRKLFESEEKESAFDYFDKFLKSLKNHKLANCYELVKLFNFIMDLNGIESKYASLLGFDHCVALIPLKKAAYPQENIEKTPISKLKNYLIADPWLGIVDYAPNIITLYKNHPDYNRFVVTPSKISTEEIKLPAEYYLASEYYHNKKLTTDEKNVFIKTNPELFINKKELIKH